MLRKMSVLRKVMGVIVRGIDATLVRKRLGMRKVGVHARVRLRTVTTGRHGGEGCGLECVVENRGRKYGLRRSRNRGDSTTRSPSEEGVFFGGRNVFDCLTRVLFKRKLEKIVAGH